MTVEQWNSLSPESKEKLITAVFNNQYLSMRAARDPNTDVLIQEVLSVTSINGDPAYVNIHKKVKVHQDTQ
jgi:hypothetical protein